MKIFVINENHYVVGVCREGTLGLFPYDYDSARINTAYYVPLLTKSEMKYMCTKHPEVGLIDCLPVSCVRCLHLGKLTMYYDISSLTCMSENI